MKQRRAGVRPVAISTHFQRAIYFSHAARGLTTVYPRRERMKFVIDVGAKAIEQLVSLHSLNDVVEALNLSLSDLL
jgi:hypothetical protein